jgi:hypothetical protein
MGCVLRAYGRNFNVDRFLETSRMSPDAVWRSGESLMGRVLRRRPTSGFTIEITGPLWTNPTAQIAATITFLKKYRSEIRRLVAFRGIEKVFCDFGVKRDAKAMMQGILFDANLTRVAGELGIGLKATYYAISSRIPHRGADR